MRRLLEDLQRIIGDPAAASSSILLYYGRTRLHLLLEPFLPHLVALAPGKIPPGLTAQFLGVIR